MLAYWHRARDALAVYRQSDLKRLFQTHCLLARSTALSSTRCVTTRCRCSLAAALPNVLGIGARSRASASCTASQVCLDHCLPFTAAVAFFARVGLASLPK